MPAEQHFKIFSDPVHGFISVPKNVLMDLIQTPEVQRLRRIRQLGVGHLVFPGAEHTRFNHALGAMALMQDALSSLTEKGTDISPQEHTAALAAALLHDVGHGAFSHTLEHTLIKDFHHEAMSRALLADLRDRFNGPLGDALRMFDDTYPRPFFHELVASQLDMDRLDYLRRDAFYTGVSEGEVGVQRIIKTLRVHNEALGVEAKGIYAVENFLLSRRLMYWQVYLHKTVLAGDMLLYAILDRAREHLQGERPCDAALHDGSPALRFFLSQHVAAAALSDPDVRAQYCRIDDTDVLYSLKQWMNSDDRVLADLCRRFINRDFLRVTFLERPPTDAELSTWRQAVARWLVATERAPASTAGHDATFYVRTGHSDHTSYAATSRDGIRIIERDGTVRELSETTDTPMVASFTDPVVKPYVCAPKSVALDLPSAA
ncbi:HD domain-containing protein [Salisaeta longa]|uniref:HD domain-containing protein n=1 Tax=Salisaeta longa TaxID=503170 RepID=UPI0004117525|nr:HD domain-containing protein [Salisaeta longa]